MLQLLSHLSLGGRVRGHGAYEAVPDSYAALQPVALQAPPAELTQDDIVHWLLGCGDEDFVDVIRRVSQFRGHLVLQAAGVVADEDGQRSPADTGMAPTWSSVSMPGEHVEIAPQAVEGRPPLVQFATADFFFHEGDPAVSVPVLRCGDLDGTSTVRFATADGSAVVGRSYEATGYELTFGPGEWEKEITVNLIDDDMWQPTVMFSLELDRQSVKGATVGEYLWKASVHIMDNDTFPSNRFAEAIERTLSESMDPQKATLSAHDAGLLFDFCKLMCMDPFIFKGAVKACLVDLAHNLYMIQMLFMQVLVVDFVLEHPAEEMRMVLTELLSMGAANMCSFGILHAMEYRRISWRLEGYMRKSLQAALLRKFLTFAQEPRSYLNHGGVILAMTRDCGTVVEEGFSNVLLLLHQLSTVLFIIAYQFMSAYAFGRRLNFAAIVPMAIYPPVYLLFLRWRWGATKSNLQASDRGHADFVATCDATVHSYPLIADYDLRDHAVATVTQALSALGAQGGATARILLNNSKFAPWLALCTLLVYSVFGGMQVVNGRVSLGIYLVNVGLFTSLGASWQQIYTTVLHMLRCVPNLHRVVLLLNLPTDERSRMQVSNFRVRMTRRMNADILSGGASPPGGISLDAVPLRIFLSPPPAAPDSDAASIDLRQGTLVYLIGPHGEGKSRLLRSLAMRDGGGQATFVPSHLRVTYVSGQPLFFRDRSLLENLMLGSVQEDRTIAAVRRVGQILERLGLPQAVSGMLAAPRAQAWALNISETQRHLLAIAPALISNPEVLCLSKPVQHFDGRTQRRLLELLREFVDCRGVCCRGPRGARRPRTCVMTTSRKLPLALADQVICTRADQGIWEVEAGDSSGGSWASSQGPPAAARPTGAPARPRCGGARAAPPAAQRPQVPEDTYSSV